MKILEVKSLAIPEVKVIKFEKFSDERGYFTEPFRKSDILNFPELRSLHNILVFQLNESYSKKNVFRGLHFQWNPYMGKLVRVIRGKMIDLALDIKRGSPTYGKIIGYELSSELNSKFGEWIWLPVGFAHGCIFLEDTIIEYLCSGEYSKNYESGISIFSKNIDWSLADKNIKDIFDDLVKKDKIILSEKDKKSQSLKEWEMKEESNVFKHSDLKERNLC
jgi:dTDP-4-dehydrorhamnose 3,5-epimerase